MLFFSGTHPRLEWVGERKKVFGDDSKIVNRITIGKHSWLGYGCIVLGGVNIGEEVTIGAGSVITHDVPSFVLAAGNPATIKKEYALPIGYGEE